MSRIHAPLLVSRIQIADVFAVNPRTIDKFTDEGMPVSERGKGGKASTYDVKACVQWYVTRERAALVGDGEGLSPQHQRALLDRKRTEDLDLRLRVRRGELVSVEEAAQDFHEFSSTIRARFRRVPDAVADRVVVASVNGPHAVKSLLLMEIDEALRELSNKANELTPAEAQGAA